MSHEPSTLRFSHGLIAARRFTAAGRGPIAALCLGASLTGCVGNVGEPDSWVKGDLRPDEAGVAESSVTATIDANIGRDASGNTDGTDAGDGDGTSSADASTATHNGSEDTSTAQDTNASTDVEPSTEPEPAPDAGKLEPICGNGVVERGEECDSDSEVCVVCMLSVPLCGDGVKQGNEECDDGNDVEDDGCDNTCNIRECGDGVVQRGEECDPPGAECGTLCELLPRNCGDGIAQADEGELCDDGNTASGDGCFECRKECGDGRVDPALGETCEPGIAFLSCQASVVDQCLSCIDTSDCGSRDVCDALTCKRRAACGNGVIERLAGEDCEPPGSATCDETCHDVPPQCGNERVESGEECDPPDGQFCSAHCTHLSCGNRIVEGEEECEPPNDITCDASCRVIPPCVPMPPPDNLLPGDGAFELGFDNWLAVDPRVTAVHVPTEGAATPGAMLIELDNQTAGGASLEARGVRLCLPVQPHVTYRFSGSYRFLADSSEESGVSVSLHLYGNDTCSGSALEPSLTRGAKGSVQRTWTAYTTTMDTSVVDGLADTLSMAVRLDVWRPSHVPYVSVLWDDVKLAPITETDSGYCGDCIVSQAEGCDDGNQTPGDGCGAFCREETCGNAVQDPGEQCDDGDLLFGDGCDPDCTADNTCRTCSFVECGAAADACYHNGDVAQAGPRAETPRGQLCSELAECIVRTGCALDTAISALKGLAGDGPAMENCYCGTARGSACFEPQQANGSCKSEVEAALETSDPNAVFQRMSGSHADYPVFTMAATLWECTQDACASRCVAELSCGNGTLEERPLAFLDTKPGTFIDGSASGLTCQALADGECYPDTTCGCFLEECDDGNAEDGDGCDSQCYIEVCGNGVLQPDLGEACDDGNVSSGDGCDEHCQPEWSCGNGVLEGSEQCDDGNAEASDGCDAFCVEEVCGNSVVQHAEECDPPNGSTCLDGCVRGTLDPCTQCVYEVDPHKDSGITCGGLAFLDVSPNAPDDLAAYNGYRCLSDPACSAVWFCYAESGCFGVDSNNHECYCGEGSDYGECVAPDFVPYGDCASSIAAAYEAQWGAAGTNAQIVTHLSDFELSQPANAPRSLGAATFAWTYCIWQGQAHFDHQMCLAGMSQARRLECSSACYGSEGLDETEVLDDLCQ